MTTEVQAQNNQAQAFFIFYLPIEIFHLSLSARACERNDK